MANIEDYKVGDSNWYEIDGQKFNGAAAAEKYLAEKAEFDAEEESALVESNDAADPEEESREAEVDDESVEVAKDVVPDNEEKEFLIQMTREARLFEIVGKSGKRYSFSKSSPIIVVKGGDVEGILAQGGFRLVSPEVAKEYYS